MVQEFDLFAIVIKHPVYVVGYLAYIETAIAVGEHRVGAVIACNNNECTVVACIEYIEVGSVADRGRWLNMCEAPSCILRQESMICRVLAAKTGCDVMGGGTINWGRSRRGHDKSDKSQHCQVFLAGNHRRVFI